MYAQGLIKRLDAASRTYYVDDGCIHKDVKFYPADMVARMLQGAELEVMEGRKAFESACSRYREGRKRRGRHYHERLKPLQHALWVERANRAAAWHTHFALFQNHATGTCVANCLFCINGSPDPVERMSRMLIPAAWSRIWHRVYLKCMAKAEEYK